MLDCEASSSLRPPVRDLPARGLALQGLCRDDVWTWQPGRRRDLARPRDVSPATVTRFQGSHSARRHISAGHASEHLTPGRVDLRVATREIASAATQAPPLEAYVEIVPGLEFMHVETRHRRNAIWSLSFRSAANIAEPSMAQIQPTSSPRFRRSWF